MPCYNASNFIGQSIGSVINQTYTNWELIIIDDGSTDNSKIICESFRLIDGRIRYYYQKNSKQARARNLGIEKSYGELIAFLDADDLWLPQKLEVTLNNFELANYDLIFTDSFFTEELNISISNSHYARMGVKNEIYCKREDVVSFLEGNKIPILTALVKKSALIKVGGFDSNCVPAEDYDLWLRLLKNGFKFQSINVPLSIYRVHDNSATTQDRLATSAVIYLLKKNFTKAEILNLNAQLSVKSWIIRKITTEKSKIALFSEISTLKHFGLLSVNLKLLILILFFLPKFIAKRGFIKYIKSA
jgi:glycosyltransferase involved in cell wall biosynthesis